MPYYALFHYTVQDPETWQKYPARAIPTIAQYGGRVLAVAAPGIQEPTVVEGSPQHAVTVVLEFASPEASERWYRSPEYQAVIGLRRDSSEGWAIGVPSFQPPAS
jgi:uncharacterized protein (DUF1330 family)